MKIWLDDCRPMPDYFDTYVKTAEEAIELLKTNKVTEISLDHDLGTEQSGYTVAKFIEESAFAGSLSPIKVYIHTQNPVGRRNIVTAIQNAERYWGIS
jgi:hypothetical protein